MTLADYLLAMVRAIARGGVVAFAGKDTTRVARTLAQAGKSEADLIADLERAYQGVNKIDIGEPGES